MNIQTKQQVYERAMPILTEKHKQMQWTKYRVAPTKAFVITGLQVYSVWSTFYQLFEIIFSIWSLLLSSQSFFPGLVSPFSCKWQIYIKYPSKHFEKTAFADNN